jgi:hypothetical protein
LFRARFATEYERFEKLLVTDGVVVREEFVGAYYEAEGEDLASV